jgi:hypothetical protein
LLAGFNQFLGDLQAVVEAFDDAGPGDDEEIGARANVDGSAGFGQTSLGTGLANYEFGCAHNTSCQSGL